MANRAKDKKEIDPEELMKRKFRAKCRFRAIGRLVLANVYWMIEDVEHYEGVDDVKRRVEQAVRSKSRKKQLLTVTDKALLNKPIEERTDHEKKYIYRIIGGLKCFKRYPNHVKKKLAAVAYFKYYGPNRIVVRQNQEAHALYFIVSGDVMVSQLVWDELLSAHESVNVGQMHAGDMFGEVSLLHNITRTATVATIGHCELLQLMKEDFKHVLQASIQAQWDEVLLAMSHFTYFDALDEVARREGCIVAKMKSYAINETILGDGAGVPNFVYFILTGRCQMIESLKIFVAKRLGHTFYTLYDPYVPEEESDEDLEKKYFAAYNDLNKDSRASAIANVSTELPQQYEFTKSSVAIHKSSMLKTASILKNISNIIEGQKSTHDSKVPIIESESFKKNLIPEEMEDDCGSSKRDSHSSSKRDSVAPQEPVDFPQIPGNESAEPPDVILEPGKAHPARTSVSFIKCLSSLVLHNAHIAQSGDSSRHRRNFFSSSVLSLSHQSTIIFFMDTGFVVCQLNPGASFGFGENMRDRRIIALTPVTCMLMPKIWLLQRNTANIWTRIQHYLEKKIPTKKQLFDEFVSQRRWHEYREQLVGDVLIRSKTVNYTSVHDVPYSIRIDEMLDL